MASRRANKTPIDEETIEWDLTEFAIEESIVKRRHRALAELKQRFEADCIRPDRDLDWVVVGRALGRGEPEAPNGAALGREEVRGLVAGPELKDTLLSDIRKRKGRPLKYGKCPGSWPLGEGSS